MAKPADCLDVSIHAPARGATETAVVISLTTAVSIHAPARGATAGRQAHIRGYKFQSTLPHGERPPRASSSPAAEEFQSTLPHGERREPRFAVIGILSFNPRSRTGSDGRNTTRTTSISSFQSTLPHGERRCCARNRSSSPESFNPRSRTGSDAILSDSSRTHASFNPRSRTGSDSSTSTASPARNEFQSTLPHGERLAISRSAVMPRSVSIHAPARGATYAYMKSSAAERVSIHAPARGATR